MDHIMKRRGFTLIELLVVIAIIAILAAILFPVFTRAKKSAQLATCQGNLKQWVLAMQRYADDNNGKYPWAGATYQYPHSIEMGGGKAACDSLEGKYLSTKGMNMSLRFCPLYVTAIDNKKWVNPKSNSFIGWGYWYYCDHALGYNYNAFFSTSMLCGYGQSDISAPSKKPCLSESGSAQHFRDASGNFIMTQAFCDGHVKATNVNSLTRVRETWGMRRDGTLDPQWETIARQWGF